MTTKVTPVVLHRQTGVTLTHLPVEAVYPTSKWNGGVYHFGFPEGTPISYYVLRADPLWGILTEASNEIQISWFETLGTSSGRAREALKVIKETFNKPIVAWDCGNASKYEGEEHHPLIFWSKMMDEGLIDRLVTTEDQRDYQPSGMDPRLTTLTS